MAIWGTGILNGLRITMRNMLRGPITLKYPYEKLELTERARWAVRMLHDESGNHLCTGCMACQKACPDEVIDIVIEKTDDGRFISTWEYDIGACMMCGLCVEACTFSAIHMSHDYELARFDPAELVETLLENTPVAKPKKKAAAEKPVDAVAPAEGAAPVDVAAPEPKGGDDV